MRQVYALEAVEDAHVDLMERFGSYYDRYVGTMWNVVILHSKSVVGDELWPDYMSEFEDEYAGQVYLEQELCTILDREEGLDARTALDELHDQLERAFRTELLAQRGMTVALAAQLEYLSRHRLTRHAALRKHVRYCIDTAQFYVIDTAAKMERKLPEAQIAAHASLALMVNVQPRAPLL